MAKIIAYLFQACKKYGWVRRLWRILAQSLKKNDFFTKGSIDRKKRSGNW